MIRDLVTLELKSAEGFKPKPYLDTNGVWTTGWGFTSFTKEEASMAFGNGSSVRTVNKNIPPISRTAADKILDMKIQSIFVELQRELPFFPRTPDNVKRVLVGMAYNNGIKGLLGFQNMIKAIERNDYGRAAVECLDSKNGRDKHLYKRYVRYANMLLAARKR